MKEEALFGVNELRPFRLPKEDSRDALREAHEACILGREVDRGSCLARLQGSWLGANGCLVGRVEGRRFHWSDAVRHAPQLASARGRTELWEVGKDQVVLGTAEQSFCEAILFQGPPARLIWADGTVWTRIEEMAGASAEGGDTEAAEHWPPSGDEEPGLSWLPGGVRRELEAVDGVWIERPAVAAKSMGEVPTCTIEGSQVSWNQKLFWGHAGTCLRRAANGVFSMDVRGKTYTASLAGSSPAILVWSDGAAWVRDELQGVWVADLDSSPICVVQDGRLCWDPAIAQPEAALRPIPVLPSSPVRLVPRAPGEERQAIFNPGPPARLAWKDGSVWRRMSLDIPGGPGDSPLA